MKTMQFKQGTSFEPITEEHLEEADEFFDEFIGGKRFPLALIELLKKSNGGEPVQRYFKTQTNEYPIRLFYNLSDDETIIAHESNGIFDKWHFLKNRFNNPLLVPIADTTSGDIIVLDYNGTAKDNPRVALWFHECDEKGEFSYPMEHIADNMEAFLDLLTEVFTRS
ncbi:SMI1/KNR4 family protein [Photobacterium sp. 1_MG-2023]|uniref:SMI1/KNR4 family protein n=1 Tax=Photobacterium sp. 1_MG-2023 TaxID=3062646 RepID=UPI0026E40B05|nr:SMI1/KNR4 family protein [Photobacterium sp. 1_MG-2023]MDO6707941.1 SMI1/KNR4 family protein [Photobacterium sp. 1_MG-2023]